MKRTLVALLLSSLVLAACADQPKSGSYLVAVKDPASGKPIEGASVEMIPLSGPPVTGATDNEGEVVLLLGAWPRAELEVGFDGESDRYFVRTGRVPAWTAPAEETGSGEQGVLRFLRGSGAAAKPHFAVQFVYLKPAVR